MRLNLTPVKRSSDIVALRQLYDACEVQIRGLESLGVVLNMYVGLLCTILLKNIPEDRTLAYTGQAGPEHKLLTFLQQEIKCRERAVYLTKVGSPN